MCKAWFLVGGQALGFLLLQTPAVLYDPVQAWSQVPCRPEHRYLQKVRLLKGRQGARKAGEGPLKPHLLCSFSSSSTFHQVSTQRTEGEHLFPPIRGI